jgi:hypothetical protein
MVKRALITALSILAFSLPAAAAQSIVGAWDFPASNCSSPIRLGPMSMKSEDVTCRFTSVTRKGNTVTWKGVCDDAEGSAPQTVTAKLGSNGRLTIRYAPGGNVLAGLMRCN